MATFHWNSKKLAIIFERGTAHYVPDQCGGGNVNFSSTLKCHHPALTSKESLAEFMWSVIPAAFPPCYFSLGGTKTLLHMLTEEK